nr:hypothetical protein K-LCC10_0149 [Kaumoebavirus]
MELPPDMIRAIASMDWEVYGSMLSVSRSFRKALLDLDTENLFTEVTHTVKIVYPGRRMATETVTYRHIKGNPDIRHGEYKAEVVHLKGYVNITQAVYKLNVLIKEYECQTRYGDMVWEQRFERIGKDFIIDSNHYRDGKCESYRTINGGERFSICAVAKKLISYFL